MVTISAPWNRLKSSLALPVLMKEMRSRMRGQRSAVLLFVTTAVSIGVGLIIISSQWGENYSDPVRMYGMMAETGRNLFTGLTILQALLCALVAPALTAGAISLEREQQTFDFLLLTRMSSANIVLGKFLSSLSFIFIILLCALPVASICFILGGVDPAHFFWVIMTILATTCCFGAIGLYSSARAPRTATAVSIAFLICLAWIFLPALLLESLKAALGLWYSENHPIRDFTFLFLITSVLAVIPTTVLTVLLSTITHRPRSRRFNLITWSVLVVAALMVLFTNSHQISSAIDDKIVFLGSPFGAMQVLLDNNNGLFDHSSFVPITILLMLLGTWVFITLAAGAIRVLRDR